MIHALQIKNFRSVKDQTVDLKPLVFLYGNNATGKSSLFYSLIVLRNVVSNPNQPIDSFFNLIFANLGGFKHVVSQHDETRSILIAVKAKVRNTSLNYGVKLNPKQGEFFLNLGAPYFLELVLPVTFPYPMNGNAQKSITLEGVSYSVSWNGITAQVAPSVATEESNKQALTITSIINNVAGLVRSIDVVPLRRGFFKHLYGPMNISQFPMSDDEVAAMLAAEEYIDTKVNTNL